jgi:hypothetical protein
VISLGFKISDLCCEQKAADYFIPLSIQKKATCAPESHISASKHPDNYQLRFHLSWKGAFIDICWLLRSGYEEGRKGADRHKDILCYILFIKTINIDVDQKVFGGILYFVARASRHDTC